MSRHNTIGDMIITISNTNEITDNYVSIGEPVKLGLSVGVSLYWIKSCAGHRRGSCRITITGAEAAQVTAGARARARAP